MTSYTVNLNGPAPWGFRLQGGKDFNLPLSISRITPGSKAVDSQLAQGDIISAINDFSTDGMTHLEAQNKIKAAANKLSLTMQKSKRPMRVNTGTHRMDSPMPIIPHQKDLEKVGQYNSPIGLYSPETLREMMQMQGKLEEGLEASRRVSSFGFTAMADGKSSGVGERALGQWQEDAGSIMPAAPPHSVHGDSHFALGRTHWREQLLYTVIANTAGNVEYTPSFNPIALKDSALSTHKPIEVKGPGGKTAIVHAQYNTPISMYSQDAIMDAIAGQSQGKGHEGEEAGSPLSGALPVKDPVVDCASPVYQAVIRPGENNQDMAEWARRAANLQSKSFRMLAHITGTEYMQDPDEEALAKSREKFESEVKGPRFAKLKNWHQGLSSQILNVQE